MAIKSKYVVTAHLNPEGQMTSCFIWKKYLHFGTCKYIYTSGHFRVLRGGSLSPVKVFFSLSWSWSFSWASLHICCIREQWMSEVSEVSFCLMFVWTLWTVFQCSSNQTTALFIVLPDLEYTLRHVLAVPMQTGSTQHISSSSDMKSRQRGFVEM